MRFQELYERCAKAIGIGIILSKRKGGIASGSPPFGCNGKAKEKQRESKSNIFVHLDRF